VIEIDSSLSRIHSAWISARFSLLSTAMLCPG